MPAALRHDRPWLRFGASHREWRDWRWQLRNAIGDRAGLERHLALTPEEIAGLATARFPLRVTPYYLSLADPDDANCPVRMQIVPRPAESRAAPGERRDPLGEDERRPVRAVVHRYPDRVLLLATSRCAVHCRHCTRRRLTGSGEQIGRDDLEQAVGYIARKREIRDVLVSGGDPLVLSDARLAWLLGRLKAVRHVQIVRIGTRVPVCNPVRVTRALARLLRAHAPIFVVTHFNHPKEMTREAREACAALVDRGIPVENQTVLIRRLNSSARVVTDLCHRLLEARVRPYYLHQMDVARGLEHLRTPLATGVEIIEAMRGHTSGLAVPHFAVDLPGGGGKVTVQPQYVVSKGKREVAFRSWQGETRRVREPRSRDCRCPYEASFYRDSEP